MNLVLCYSCLKTRNSARLTDQRGSYAFSCSPFSIHVSHLLPTSNIDILVSLGYILGAHSGSIFIQILLVGSERYVRIVAERIMTVQGQFRVNQSR